MEKEVSLKGVCEMFLRLSGAPPYVELNFGSHEFVANTSLQFTNGRSRYNQHIRGIDKGSADLALLKAYQLLHQAPQGFWVKGTGNGAYWEWDKEYGWSRRGSENL